MTKPNVWVTKTEAGEFAVVDDGCVVAGPYRSNSEAWKVADRLAGEFASKHDATVDWIWRKQIGSL